MLAVDTHVHIYPCHRAGRLLDGAMARLGALAPGAQRALCLAERRECDWFREALEGTPPGGWERDDSAEAGVLALRNAAGAGLWVFAGRQMNTRERLEILALATPERFEDKLPIRDLVAQVNASGGLAVLPWSPGKWMFGRGRIVEQLQVALPPGALLLGDSSLRCAGWPTPAPMAIARLSGRPPLAGTDPLPFPGEEEVAGTYASVFDADLDPLRPLASFRALLREVPARTRGRRSSPLAMLRRMARNRAAKRPV